MNSFFQMMLASNKAEALSWLRNCPEGSFRSIGEFEELEESIGFVERLYDLGAVEVLAVQIDVEGEVGQTTNHLVLKLPADAGPRARLFEFERTHAASQGFDGEPDSGQEYLYLRF